jgi:hypothetical protein
MRRRFGEIVEFSGLGDFIDQPVRFYSSGMYVRLGFSVAVQVDPDILLVDEVLAVGDADFQRRCLEKMDSFRKAGKTLLLISHDIETVRRVSDRIAYLSHGHLESFGDPSDVAEKYMSDSVASSPALKGCREWGEPGTAFFTSFSLLDPETGEEKRGSACPATVKPVFRLRWHAEKRIENPVVGFSIDDTASGCRVFGTNTQICGKEIPFIDGDGQIDFTLDTSNLQCGDYALSFALHSADHTVNYHRVEHGFALRVRDRKWFDGLVRLPVSWN